MCTRSMLFSLNEISQEVFAKDHGVHGNFNKLDDTFQWCLSLPVMMEVEGGPNLHYSGRQRPTGSSTFPGHWTSPVLFEGGHHGANDYIKKVSDSLSTPIEDISRSALNLSHHSGRHYSAHRILPPPFIKNANALSLLHFWQWWFYFIL